MDDVIKRLRDRESVNVREHGGDVRCDVVPRGTCDEAADTIERMEAQRIERDQLSAAREADLARVVAERDAVVQALSGMVGEVEAALVEAKNINNAFAVPNMGRMIRTAMRKARAALALVEGRASDGA